MSARAGWFPDPAGRPGHYRWWDGSAWTRFLTADPNAPEPDAVAGAPDPEPQGRHQAPAPASWQRAGDVVAAELPAGGRSGPPGYERPAGVPTSGRSRPPGYERPADGRQRSSLKAALMGIGVLVIAAVIVLAIALSGASQQTVLDPPAKGDVPSAPVQSAPPSAIPTGPTTFDPTTRKFSMDGLEITMPGSPYTVHQTGFSYLGGPGVDGTASVHAKYNGKSDWTAAVSAGRVGQDLVGKNLNDTADKIMSNWAATAFDGPRVKIRNVKQSTVTKNEPRPARIVTADVHYQLKGLASRYDHVSLLVTKGPSGNYIAFISSRPNDASAAIKKSLDAAINTIHLV